MYHYISNMDLPLLVWLSGENGSQLCNGCCIQCIIIFPTWICHSWYYYLARRIINIGYSVCQIQTVFVIMCHEHHVVAHDHHFLYQNSTYMARSFSHMEFALNLTLTIFLTLTLTLPKCLLLSGWRQQFDHYCIGKVAIILWHVCHAVARDDDLSKP